MEKDGFQYSHMNGNYINMKTMETRHDPVVQNMVDNKRAAKSAYDKLRYQQNKMKRKIQSANYYTAHKEHIKKTSLETQEKYREFFKRFAQHHPEFALEK